MSETQQQDQNLTGSIQSPEKFEDSRMKVNEDNLDQSSPYPDRPGEQDCQFFLRTGHCGYGNTCRYNHPLTRLPEGGIYYKDQLPERIGQPDCEYFLKTGACKYGATCKYHHPKDRNGAGPVQFNVLGFPMRQGEKSCPYYMQTGLCRFGVACKFHHPQPQSPNGHSAYAMSSFPSVGFPYASGMTMMPFPPGMYGAMPHSQVPQSQACMPFMVAPSQGLISPQGWPTYMAASNPIYNVNTQPDSSSSASVPVAVNHHSFPERAECRFLMNTGMCKYGDDCKYSHPKERMLQSLPNLSNSIVLPARPGQPACGNFKAYGFCKFGASCKFDHSMPLNPYNNTGMAMSSQPTPNSYAPPVSTHLRISSPPIPSDPTTLSKCKPATESQSSETKEQDDSPTQPEKSKVHDSLPPNRSDSITLPNGKPDAENPSSETEKQDSTTLANGKPDAENPSSETEKQDSTTLPNGKPDAENPSSETEKQDSTILPNGKPAAENPSSETEKPGDNPAQPDSSKEQDSSDKSA